MAYNFMKMVTFWRRLKTIEGEPTEKNVRGIKCLKWCVEYKFQVTRRLKGVIFSQNFQKYAKCSVLCLVKCSCFSVHQALLQGMQACCRLIEYQILTKTKKNKFWKANKTTWIENWVKKCYIPFLNTILHKLVPLHFFQQSLFLWVFNMPQKWSFLGNCRLKLTT